jgi:hypothetical protein
VSLVHAQPPTSGGTLGRLTRAAIVVGGGEHHVLRAIAAADLHNLVLQRDYRIIPAIMAGAAGKAIGLAR